MKVRLLDLAHARSGDKGDTANVGVIALKPEWYPLLARELTLERVAEHFRGIITGGVQRYEHAEAGDLLHIDTKKLGRIERPSHRVTGNRKDSVEGAGWEYLFVAVDDHARVAFTAMHLDERKESAVQFLRDAVAYYNRLGVTIKRLLTDNGSAFRSKEFRLACQQLGITHKFTRAYRPQTNGKAERFIQSALREWAYGWTYQNSAQRRQALHSWQHHYNWHRPHHGIGRVAPMSRLPGPRYNLLTVHS